MYIALVWWFWSFDILIIWALAMTLSLKIANNFFTCTPAHSNESQYQVWKQNVGLEDIIWTKIKFWPFTVTLTLNAVIQFFPQDTLAYDDISSDQVWLPKNRQFRKYSRKSHILIIWALAVTLTIATTTKMSAWLWLMMLHHHTKFGNNMVCDSENITQTNIHWHFEPLLWPWPWMQ